MMQYNSIPCQLQRAVDPHVGRNSAPEFERRFGDKSISDAAVDSSTKRRLWAPDPAETVANTASRKSGPRKWLAAIEQALEAGTVPGANEVTAVIIRDLGARMDYTTGQVRYCVQDMMRRLGLSKTAVSRHVALLRSAGWLAWAVHGSRRNILAVLGLQTEKRRGARTATVYAATIPPAWDAAEGNILIGSGYEARLDAFAMAVARLVAETTRTPSRSSVKGAGQVQMGGGRTTSTAARQSTKSHRPKKRTHTVLRHRITAERIERARQLAARIRPLVNWLQGATLNQLSWVLLDVVAMGWSEVRLLRWLHDLGISLGSRRPSWPHRVLAAALRRQEADGTLNPPLLAIVETSAASTPGLDEFMATAATADDEEAAVEYLPVEQAPENVLERLALREAAMTDPQLIVAYAEICGREAALRLYGPRAAAILEIGAAGMLGGTG